MNPYFIGKVCTVKVIWDVFHDNCGFAIKSPLFFTVVCYREVERRTSSEFPGGVGGTRKHDWRSQGYDSADTGGS